MLLEGGGAKFERSFVSDAMFEAMFMCIALRGNIWNIDLIHHALFFENWIGTGRSLYLGSDMLLKEGLNFEKLLRLTRILEKSVRLKIRNKHEVV